MEDLIDLLVQKEKSLLSKYSRDDLLKIAQSVDPRARARVDLWTKKELIRWITARAGREVL